MSTLFAEVDPIFGLYLFFVFYLLPFLLLVVLPVQLVLFIVTKFVNKKKHQLPSFKPFILSISGGVILANIIWNLALFNQVYYEWDRTILPFTLFTHEAPVLDTTVSWLAKGWQLWHLDVIWLLLTVTIYIVSVVIAYTRSKHHHYIELYKKILIYTLITLVILTPLVPSLFDTVARKIWDMPDNLNYQENSAACVPSPSQLAQVLYLGDQQEWISDIDGQNIRQAFNKYLQLRFNSNAISPDGTMAAVMWDSTIWVHCLYSDGAFKINLPGTYNDASLYSYGSNLSWSPDSMQMIMNLGGDLLLIDTGSKNTRVLKSQVAIKDNKIDFNDKDRSTMIPLFEYGSTFWAGDGLIYYTAFVDAKVILHQLDLTQNTDQIMMESDKVVSITSADPTGRYLLLNENDWSAQRNTENPYFQIYIFKLETKEKIELADQNLEVIAWSPSGNLIAQSTGGWMTAPEFRAFPAILTNLETNEQIDVTQKIIEALQSQNISIEEKIIVVEIKDFVDDKHALVFIKLLTSDVFIPEQISGIINIESGALSIIQHKPVESFDQADERIEPYLILNK